eukprot:jgi/Botrbrau1/17492/Bobra.0054s0074.1
MRRSRMPFQIFYGPGMPSPIPVQSPHGLSYPGGDVVCLALFDFVHGKGAFVPSPGRVSTVQLAPSFARPVIKCSSKSPGMLAKSVVFLVKPGASLVSVKRFWERESPVD